MNKNGIHIKTEETVLHIPIYDKITVITGDSATGKTKMMNFLKACKSAKKNNTKIESSVNIDDILLVFDEDTLKLIMEKKEEGRIIFIDRFNTMQSQEIAKFMDESKNIFIIMGHRNVSELTSQDAVLNMKCDGNNYQCEQIYINGILNPTERL